MKATQPLAEVKQLDDSPFRFAYLEHGIVRYVGSEDECMRRMNASRAKLFSDRDRQDALLRRACQ